MVQIQFQLVWVYLLVSLIKSEIAPNSVDLCMSYRNKKQDKMVQVNIARVFNEKLVPQFMIYPLFRSELMYIAMMHTRTFAARITYKNIK